MSICIRDIPGVLYLEIALGEVVNVALDWKGNLI